jgi:hypothetical protein
MNMKKLLALATLALAAVPGLAHAQWYAGARAGYALAGGKAADGSKMSDGLKSSIPIQVEGGYDVLPRLSVGAYFSYGPGQVGSACDGASCSASVMRAGVEAAWKFEPLASIAPWLGIGAGYEWARLEAKDGADKLKLAYRGLELVDLQAGADYPVTPKLSVGPFASFAVGRYDHLKVESPLGNSDGSIPSATTHTWLTFGLRGRWDL